MSVTVAAPAASIPSPPAPATPAATVQYVLSVLVSAKQNGVRVYVDHSLTTRILPLLFRLGIKVRTIPAHGMTPPYVLLEKRDETVRVTVVDASGSTVGQWDVPLPAFVEELERLAAEREKARAQSVEYVDALEVDEEAIKKIEELLESLMNESKPQQQSRGKRGGRKRRG